MARCSSRWAPRSGVQGVLDLASFASGFPDLDGLRQLAAGGQKWVYTGTHRTDGSVVLKVIKPGQDAERIRREVLAVQRIASPRVPRVLEVGTVATPVGSCIWIREQMVPGRSLRSAIQAQVLDRPQLHRLAEHMLEALAAGERVRIVHRDVKPENVILDDRGDFWLLDYGIARHLDLSSATPTAALAGPGTLGYAPPEQYRNWKREVDCRADLFALGVTLYESATGRNPFREGARDQGEVVRRIESLTVPRLVVAGDAAGAFSEFVGTLMQRRPDHRPSSAADSLDWLRSLTTRS